MSQAELYCKDLFDIITQIEMLPLKDTLIFWDDLKAELMRHNLVIAQEKY